jgi:hypothetical protein
MEGIPEIQEAALGTYVSGRSSLLFVFQSSKYGVTWLNSLGGFTEHGAAVS